MSLQPTLLHVSVGRGAQQSIPLLVVWFEYKKVHGFWKGQGLMGDLDGRPVWFTLSAPYRARDAVPLEAAQTGVRRPF